MLAWRDRLLSAVLARAQAIIAPSEFVRAEYQRQGIPADKITVIRHGLQLPDELPPREPPAGRLRVVYLGGIAWQKGVHVLVEAANRCPANIQVTIYGDLGTQPDYAAALIRQTRQANVNFAGRLEHEKVWPALAAADVVVVPSLWYETSSLIAAEAQAAGAVVIASNVGALPERVTDGQDGLLFPAGDAAALRRLLLELLDRPERLHQLQAGIVPVRRIEQHVQDIEALYQSVLKSSGSVA
jgi:glycosyltransferase involved in cell wall biosynthesis